MQTEIFFNTVDIKGEALEKAKVNCAKQEIEVLEFYVNNNTQSFTPLQVWDHVGGLFTSVRRSITNLTNRGYLVKTSEQIVERYGQKNHKWKIRL